MTGLGLLLMYLAYCGFYWSWNAIQGKDQDSFVHYIFPFVSNSTTPGSGVNLLGTTQTGSPANNSPTPAPPTPAQSGKPKRPTAGSSRGGTTPTHPGAQ